MEQLSFTLRSDDIKQPAIGLVVLQSDETMEHELRQWLPKHYRLFHTRIPNSQQIDTSSLTAMRELLPQSVSLLPSHTDFRVIAYGCTSAATVIGEKSVKEAIHSIYPACRVTNPVSAIKAQLRALNAKRIAVLTPYKPVVSQAVLNHLEAQGYRIVRAATFNEPHDDRVARISPESLHAAIDALGAGHDVDAIVASCTNLRTFNLLQSASDRIGCPVISSNSALAWHIRALAA